MSENFFEFKLADAPNDDMKELILYGPKNIHRPITDKLYSMFISGITNLSNSRNQASHETSNDENPFKDVTAMELIWTLRGIPSPHYDFFKTFCEEFKALILSDQICKMKKTNGNLPVGYYDQMTIGDGDRLIGEYFKNFFINSLSF